MVRVKKIDLEVEKKVVIGMIVSDEFLKKFTPIYLPELFQGPHLRMVGDWCQGYFDKYKKAPGKDIEDIFNSRVRRGMISEEDAGLISDILTTLSQDYESGEMKFNEAYLLDQAEIYFKNRSLLTLADDIKTILSGKRVKPTSKDWEEAERAVIGYKRVELPTSAGINPFEGEDLIRESFEKEEELFRFPGKLGQDIGPFTRDSFAAYMGPEKRGKTFWLMETAIRAVRSKCKVALISAGDMSQRQMALRLYVYITKKHYHKRYCGKEEIPTMDCWFNQINSCRRPERICTTGVIADPENPRDIRPFKDAEDYQLCTTCRGVEGGEWRGAVWYKYRMPVEPLEWREAVKASQAFLSRYGSKTFRLISYPNNSISVNGIRSLLDRWEDEGFVPDVILIDYADILAPVDSKKEFRHQQNETWQELRALSQERYCCVITATQADAASYTARNIVETHFSEDKRKYSHVNKGIITLNQTAEDKRRKIMRIGQMFVREDDFDIRHTTTVLQGLVMGRPYLDSF